jgi:hypothetical protein
VLEPALLAVPKSEGDDDPVVLAAPNKDGLGVLEPLLAAEPNVKPDMVRG